MSAQQPFNGNGNMGGGLPFNFPQQAVAPVSNPAPQVAGNYQQQPMNPQQQGFQVPGPNTFTFPGQQPTFTIPGQATPPQVGTIPMPYMQQQVAGQQQQQFAPPAGQPQLPVGYQSWEQVYADINRFQTQQTVPQADPWEAMQKNNEQWQQQFEKMLGAMSQTQASSGPDYLSMSAEELEDELTKNGSKVLTSVRDQAVREAELKIREPLTKEINSYKGVADTLMRQIAQIQAASQVQSLKETYSADPNFQEHLKAASDFLATPAGKQLHQTQPAEAITLAYHMQLSKRMFDPNFQTQMAQSLLAAQQQQNMNRMQGSPGMGVTQHQQPFQQWGPMQQQPQQGESDADVLRKILSMGNNLGFPNVQVVPTPQQQQMVMV